MTEPTLTRKYYAADEVNFTPGERSDVSWITTDVVDHEGDVVVSSGIDYKSVFLPNPVVMAVHDYGRWPVGRCEWVKAKRGPAFSGLTAKTLYDDDPDADAVWKKVKGGTVKGKSIGFRPPDDMQKGEWGPPTKEELKARPDWAAARRIIRRCVMIEYSVCPIPMNPTALTLAVSKGLHKYMEPPPVDEPETKADGSEGTDAGTEPEAGRVDRPELPEAAAEPLTKALADDDEDGEPADDGPVRNGHFVKVTKGPHKGVMGKVKSVHRSGLVPDVDDDVPCTKADPGMRVCCYKAVGEGYKESSHHVGCKMAHAEKTDDLKPPRARKGIDPVTLPPLTGRTDDAIAATQLKGLRSTLAETLRKQEDRALGAV